MRRRPVLQGLLGGALGSGLGLSASIASPIEGARYDVVVIGAGIAGLTAASLLIDHRVLVLEASGRPGGRAVVGRRNGWVFAQGTEYLGRPEGVLARLISAHGLTKVEIPDPMDVRFDGQRFFVGAAGQARLLIENGGLWAFNRFVTEVNRLAALYEEIPDHDPEGPLGRYDDLTCRAWFEALDLPEIYHQTFNVMLRGLFGATLDEVSALSCVPEIGFDFEGIEPLADLAELDAWQKDAEGSGAYSFVTGIGSLTDALAARLGSGIRYNAEAVGVSWDGRPGYRVRLRNVDGRSSEIACRAVILAVPLPIAHRIAAGVLPKEIALASAAVAYSQFVTVAMFSETPIMDRAFDLSLPDGWFLTDLYDGTWLQRHFDSNAQHFPGAVTVGYAAPDSYRDTGFTGRSDAEICARCRAEIDRIFPGASRRVTGFEVTRFEHAYPVMVPGAYRRLSGLHRAPSTGVQLAGDGAIYPTFEAAVDSGELAADRVRRWLADAL